MSFVIDTDNPNPEITKKLEAMMSELTQREKALLCIIAQAAHQYLRMGNEAQSKALHAAAQELAVDDREFEVAQNAYFRLTNVGNGRDINDGID